MRKTILAVLAFVTVATATFGAETEQKFGFNPESFEIRYFVQPRYSWFSGNVDIFDEKLGPGTDNSFGIRRSEVTLTSTVVPNTRGRLQLDVKPDKVEALDLYFEWTLPIHNRRPLSFTVGQFKKPFSYQEFVMASNNLNLIDRTFSNVFLEKKVLASSRDQGVMAAADLWEYGVPVLLNVGVFNGGGLGKKVDTNSGKQIVGRAEVTPLTGVSLGGSAEINHRGYASDSTQVKDYVVWGGDLVLARSGFQLVAEVFGGDNSERFVSEGGAFPEAPTFLSWYAEAIYRARSGWEPAVRFESFDPDRDSGNDGRTILTGQIAYSLSPNFRWQVNVAHQIFQDEAKDSLTGLYSQWTLRL